MEGSEYKFCCEQKKECRKPGCLEIIAIILGVLFTAVVGALVGTALSAIIIGALAAVIVLAIVLGVLLILNIILIICKCARNKKCY